MAQYYGARGGASESREASGHGPDGAAQCPPCTTSCEAHKARISCTSISLICSLFFIVLKQRSFRALSSILLLCETPTHRTLVHHLRLQPLRLHTRRVLRDNGRVTFIARAAVGMLYCGGDGSGGDTESSLFRHAMLVVALVHVSEGVCGGCLVEGRWQHRQRHLPLRRLRNHLTLHFLDQGILRRIIHLLLQGCQHF